MVDHRRHRLTINATGQQLLTITDNLVGKIVGVGNLVDPSDLVRPVTGKKN